MPAASPRKTDAGGLELQERPNPGFWFMSDRLLEIISILFMLWGGILLYGYFFPKVKVLGLLLGGIVLSVSGIVAFGLMSWWPLFVGVLLAYISKWLGFEPGSNR